MSHSDASAVRRDGSVSTRVCVTSYPARPSSSSRSTTSSSRSSTIKTRSGGRALNSGTAFSKYSSRRRRRRSRRTLGVRGWQRKEKRGALTGVPFGPDAAAVAIDDAIHHREPDPGTLELGAGVKALQRLEKLADVGHVES